jgi:hypothetical protein
MLLDFIHMTMYAVGWSNSAPSDLENPPQYFGIASAKKKKQKRDMNEGSGDETMFLPSSK